MSSIEEAFIKECYKRPEAAEIPSYEIIIPSVPRAELIAVKALEQIAKNQNVPNAVTAQLQTALIHLFTDVITQKGPAHENFHLRFECSEDTFKIEIKIPFGELVFPVSTKEAISDNQLIKSLIDDIKLERIKSGTKIILIKNLKPQEASNFTD